MAEVDFSGWLARKYDIMQQNANTNAAEVEQKDAAATMQYGIGGVYDRGEAAATKRKKMELDQQESEFGRKLPLIELEIKSAASEKYAQAGNLKSQTNFNTAIQPYYVEGAKIENAARVDALGLKDSSAYNDLVPKDDRTVGGNIAMPSRRNDINPSFNVGGNLDLVPATPPMDDFYKFQRRSGRITGR